MINDKYPRFEYSTKGFSANNGDGWEVITIKDINNEIIDEIVIANNSKRAVELAIIATINTIDSFIS